MLVSLFRLLPICNLLSRFPVEALSYHCIYFLLILVYIGEGHLPSSKWRSLIPFLLEVVLWAFIQNLPVLVVHCVCVYISAFLWTFKNFFIWKKSGTYGYFSLFLKKLKKIILRTAMLYKNLEKSQLLLFIWKFHYLSFSYNLSAKSVLKKRILTPSRLQS